MLRRLVKASAIVVGVGLAVAACAPVKMGAAAIVGNERITIATLDTEVTNLSQAAAQYPAAVNLTATQRTQATLTWLIRYQIFEEMARQAGHHGLDRPGPDGAEPGRHDGGSLGRAAGPDQRHPYPDPGRERHPAEHLGRARPVRGDRQPVPDDRQRRYRPCRGLGRPDRRGQQAQPGRVPGGQGPEHLRQPAVRAAGLQRLPGRHGALTPVARPPGPGEARPPRSLRRPLADRPARPARGWRPACSAGRPGRRCGQLPTCSRRPAIRYCPRSMRPGSPTGWSSGPRRLPTRTGWWCGCPCRAPTRRFRRGPG